MIRFKAMGDENKVQRQISLNELLSSEKQRLFIDGKGGVSLPVAGGFYWFLLGVLGLVVEVNTWSYVALYLSGTIIPFGFLLAKPLKSSLELDPAFKELVLLAITTMILGISISVILVIQERFEYVPLTLAIGMGIHWPIFSWIYDQRLYLYHGVIRTSAVILVWYVFPELRTVAVPFLVTLIYWLTIILILKKVKTLENETAQDTV